MISANKRFTRRADVCIEAKPPSPAWSMGSGNLSGTASCSRQQVNDRWVTRLQTPFWLGHQRDIAISFPTSTVPQACVPTPTLDIAPLLPPSGCEAARFSRCASKRQWNFHQWHGYPSFRHRDRETWPSLNLPVRYHQRKLCTLR